MANKNICSIAFQQALADKLGYSLEEIASLREEYFAKVKEVDANFNKYKATDAYEEAVKQMLNERRIKNIIKRRLAYQNLEKRLSIERFILQDGFTGGVKASTDAFFQLVEAKQKARVETYLSYLKKRLEGRDGSGLDITRQANSGKYDMLIQEEMYYLDNPDAVARDKQAQYKDGSFTGDPIAYKLAQIYHQSQRIAAQEAINAGADIHLIQGYMVKQTHAQDKFLSSKYGKTEAEQKAHWKETILQHLDIQKTFGDLPTGVTRDMVLDNIWFNVTKGHHLKYTPEEVSYIPGKNITKKATAERKLFFKSGKDAYEYNLAYGTNNLRESVMQQLHNMARTTVLLETMGTNPRYNFTTAYKSITNHILEHGNLKDINYVNNRAGYIAPSLPAAAQHQLAEILGETSAPGNVTLAKINATIRAANNVTYLSGSLITSFTDLASAPTIAHLQGRSTVTAFLDALKGLGGMVNDPVYRDILESICVVNDAFIGQVTEKFSGEVGISKLSQKISNKFFLLTGLRFWTDRIRAAQTLGMARDLAKASNLSYSELNVNMKNFFRRMNISESDWDIFRKYGIKEATNGEKFMLNEALMEIPDEEIANIYNIKRGSGKNSVTMTKEGRIFHKKIMNAKKQLAEKLQTALLFSGRETMLFPTVTETGFAKQGLAAGTFTGEAMRHLMQFKQFPLAFHNIILKGLAREWQEAGPMQAIKTGAVMMVGLIGLTYISMTIKDALNNRTPRDITDPKVFAEIIARSGALSLYGDILFNDTSRSANDLIGGLAGPTASTIGEFSQIISKAAWNGENVSDELAKFAIRKSPALATLHPSASILAYTNSFYLKPILDYYIYNGINEWLNPGYNERTRARLLKQGRDYLIDPRY